MGKKSLLLSVCRFARGYFSEQGVVENAKNMQKSISSKFTARRSVGQTDRTFITDSYKIMNFSIVIVGLVIFWMLLGFGMYLSGLVFVDYTKGTVVSVKDSLLHKLQEKLSGIIDEGKYFALTLSSVMDPSVFEHFSADNATEIAELFQSTGGAKSESSLWFEMQLSTNYVVSYKPPIAHLQSGAKLMYVDGGSTDLRVKEWDTETEEINASYPFSGGDQSSTVVEANKTTLFQKALKNPGLVVFDDPMFGFFPDINKAIAIAAVTASTASAVNCVIEVALDISLISDYIKSIVPSNNSRYAIATNTGTLIAMVGEDSLIDVFQGSLISKTLGQLRDTVWSAAYRDKRLQENSNFTAILDIGNEQKEYIISVIPVRIGPSTNWTIYSLFCYSDILPESLSSQKGRIILYILASFTVGTVLFTAYLIISQCAQIRKNVPITMNQNLHIQKDSLPVVIDNIHKLQQRTYNIETSKELKGIVDDMEHSSERSILSLKEFTKSQIDSLVGEKIMSVFGGNKLGGYADILGFNQFYSSRCESTSFRSYREDVIDPRPELSTITRKETEILILQAFARCSSIFDQEKLENYIKETISAFPDQELPYLADSISFILVIYEKKIRFSNDVFFGILVNVLVYHKLMKRRKTKSNILKRFFVLNHIRPSQVSFLELDKLYNLIKDQNESSWTIIVQTVLRLSLVIPLDTHLSLLMETPLYRGDLSEIEKASSNQTCELAKVIFVASMTSYLYHSPTQARVSLEELSGSTSNQIANCITNEYCFEVRRALTDIVGRHFLKCISGCV